jgi:predicted permease
METYRMLVSETFFSTMGIPILEGRAFNESDIRAVVVNETFVKRFSPGQSPVGQTMDNVWGGGWQIVGVCTDTRYKNIKEEIPPVTYFSYRGRIPGEGCFTVRTKLHPLAMADAVRRAVAEIDLDIPVANIRTQEQVRDGNINQERFLVTLCGALAVLTLLLSCIGLYGLMAYHVARRTNEMAIRMAVGARSKDVARPILCEAFLLATIGIIVGLPIVFAASRLIRSQLYDVQPNDPITFGIVIATLVTVSLLAAWLPARRAAKTDPMEALRYE